MAWIEVRQRAHHVAYRVGWRDPSGKTKVKTFTRQADAQRFAREIEHRRDVGYVDPSAGKVPFGKYMEDVLERAPLRPKTREWYRTHAKHLPAELLERPLNSIGTKDVRQVLSDVSRTKGASTVDAVRQLLRRVFAEASADELVTRNPVAGVKTPKPRVREPRFLSADEVASLADAVPERYRALILLLAYGGLRIGEALALEVRDVDVLRGRVDVHASVTEVGGRQIRGETKTGRRRTVHIPRFVAEALGEHITPVTVTQVNRGLVFTTSTGAPVRAGNFRRRVFDKAVATAGIEPKPTLHDLRHTAASLAIAAGAHPKEMSDMLGHSTVRVTLDTYGHLFPALHERLAERLDAVAREARPARGHVGTSSPPAGG